MGYCTTTSMPQSPNTCHGISSWSLVKLLSCECHRKPLMISQHWFGYWLGALNSSQQAITRVNNDPDLRHHMASLGQIAFRTRCISPKQTVLIKINTLWLGVHFNNNHSLTIVIQMEMSCSCNSIPGVPIGIISLYTNLDKSKIAVRLKFPKWPEFFAY